MLLVSIPLLSCKVIGSDIKIRTYTNTHTIYKRKSVHAIGSKCTLLESLFLKVCLQARTCRTSLRRQTSLSSPKYFPPLPTANKPTRSSSNKKRHVTSIRTFTPATTASTFHNKRVLRTIFLK